ncbi:MAG: hypothetical protein ACPGYV_05655 [Phycisphaeraceae bacterium]
MTIGRIEGQAGYATLARTMAQRALGIATDTAPTRARAGERRWALASALPAARVLIEQGGASEPNAQADRQSLRDSAAALHATLAEPTGKTTDGFGHHRPSYGLLAVHLMGTAARLIDDRDTLELVAQAAAASLNTHSTTDDDPRLGVWRRLIARQHGLQEAEPVPLASDDPAPLVSLGLDDLIDSWTYRELVGLHGLHLCAILEGDAALHRRARAAAEYHLGHTQPDYTTYQPWGLAAFASDASTTVFAEQQLHDVATHLSIEGPGGAVLPALLLADAYAALSGRSTRAWAKA